MEDYFNCYRAQLKEALDSLDGSVLNAVYHAMEKARQTGKQIFVLGNGGSAAAASHWDYFSVRIREFTQSNPRS